MQIPLCLEDLEETDDDPSLFDDNGFLVSVCHKHANAVMSRAVDGRACTGEGCSAAPGAKEQAPTTPKVRRVLVDGSPRRVTLALILLWPDTELPPGPSPRDAQKRDINTQVPGDNSYRVLAFSPGTNPNPTRRP